MKIFKNNIILVLVVFLCSCQGSIDIILSNKTDAEISVISAGHQYSIDPMDSKIIRSPGKDGELIVRTQNKELKYRWPFRRRPISRTDYFDKDMRMKVIFDSHYKILILPIDKQISDDLDNDADVIRISAHTSAPQEN